MKKALTLFALFALAGSPLLAQAPACSNLTLRGTYVGIHSGWTTTPVVTPGGTTMPPFTFEMISRITFDGRGNATGTITANFFGVVSKGTYSNFTYVVNDDCTVKMTFKVVSPAVPGLLPAGTVGPNQHEGSIRVDGEEAYTVSVAATPNGQGMVDQMARTVLKRLGPFWVL